MRAKKNPPKEIRNPRSRLKRVEAPMYTGIVTGIALVQAIEDQAALRVLTLDFPETFCDDLALGASVSVDGVCLTVAKILSPSRVIFDVMRPTLQITTLGQIRVGESVNVQRAAKTGTEIGGHLVSGHVDFSTSLDAVTVCEGNKTLRFALPSAFAPYVFSKGYICVNGASLTVAVLNKAEGWFEVSLIPETRRLTVFDQKQVGDRLNIEIDRQTQILVDTIKETLSEALKSYRFIE